jgi:thiol-disulfide isomerase/thioredoxin
MTFIGIRLALPAIVVSLATAATSAQAAGEVCNVARHKVNLNFSAKDINGKDVRLSQYKGQVVLVNFWATWCVPCRREIPSLMALYRDYKDRGFVVLGVSVDKEVRLIKPYARAMKMNYPVLIGAGHDQFNEAFGPFIGFPTSVILERDGTVCVRHIGLPSRSLLEKQVDALLSG